MAPPTWSFSEDVMTRFVGYGWNVTRVSDANNLDMLNRAYQTFLDTKDRPTLIVVDSHIGYGSPHKHDSSEAHGEPLGEEEVRLTKRNYGWPEDAKFLVPEGVKEHFRDGIGKRGRDLHSQWKKMYADYAKQYPQQDEQLRLMQRRELPDGWDKNLPSFPADPKGIGTRESGGKALNALAQNIPWLVGGSADLGNSNKTALKFEGAGNFAPGSYGGRNIHFGVREHAMGAALNGMSVSKLRPFDGTFFNFSDYLRPTIRLAALMETPVIHVFTHDSIGLGEDGPTHQPIEQLPALRAVPNTIVLRPGDANEVVEAWKIAVQTSHGPVLLVLSRQAVPTLDRTKYASATGVAKGAYVLADAPGGKPDVILIGTGSELSLCVDAAEKLKAEGVQARVVSMPSWELFEKQDQGYKDSVLPPSVSARVSVEMSTPQGWERYVGFKGQMIGMHSFGASAPWKDLQKHFGFTTDAVIAAARKTIAASK